jgi:hypothetical protein
MYDVIQATSSDMISMYTVQDYVIQTMHSSPSKDARILSG